MNNSFCPHCRSGHDPVLIDSTWSCGVRFNDPQWRTKECYKRNLELANERIKRLEETGDELLSWIPVDWVSDSNRRLLSNAWAASKEAKP